MMNLPKNPKPYIDEITLSYPKLSKKQREQSLKRAFKIIDENKKLIREYNREKLLKQAKKVGKIVREHEKKVKEYNFNKFLDNLPAE